jgi:hypothetical protein
MIRAGGNPRVIACLTWYQLSVGSASSPAPSFQLEADASVLERASLPAPSLSPPVCAGGWVGVAVGLAVGQQQPPTSELPARPCSPAPGLPPPHRPCISPPPPPTTTTYTHTHAPAPCPQALPPPQAPPALPRAFAPKDLTQPASRPVPPNLSPECSALAPPAACCSVRPSASVTVAVARGLAGRSMSYHGPPPAPGPPGGARCDSFRGWPASSSAASTLPGRRPGSISDSPEPLAAACEALRCLSSGSSSSWVSAMSGTAEGSCRLLRPPLAAAPWMMMALHFAPRGRTGQQGGEELRVGGRCEAPRACCWSPPSPHAPLPPHPATSSPGRTTPEAVQHRHQPRYGHTHLAASS